MLHAALAHFTLAFVVAGRNTTGRICVEEEELDPMGVATCRVPGALAAARPAAVRPSVRRARINVRSGAERVRLEPIASTRRAELASRLNFVASASPGQ